MDSLIFLNISSFSGFPGRQAGSLPRDSATSQAGSTISWEGSSLTASQAGSQAGDSTTSQASSAITPNNIPTREGHSHAGSNPSTQAGSNSDRQAGRHSTRCRAPQASQGNNATSQASRINSQEGTQPPTPQ